MLACFGRWPLLVTSVRSREESLKGFAGPASVLFRVWPFAVASTVVQGERKVRFFDYGRGIASVLPREAERKAVDGQRDLFEARREQVGAFAGDAGACVFFFGWVAWPRSILEELSGSCLPLQRLGRQDRTF